MLPSRCVQVLFKCIGEHVVGLAATTLSKGPSSAAAATPRVDVERGPQAAAALDCVELGSHGLEIPILSVCIQNP